MSEERKERKEEREGDRQRERERERERERDIPPSHLAIGPSTTIGGISAIISSGVFCVRGRGKV